MPASTPHGHEDWATPRSAEAARVELLHLLARFTDGRSTEPFPMDRAALLLALDEYPGLRFETYALQLDGYAAAVRERLPGFRPDAPDVEPLRALSVLRQVVFEDAGFHGNREHYEDPRNSYLNEVLDRKLGLPITLATVVLGITRRLNWPVHGVNFPQHFLLVWRGPGTLVPLDPFDGLVLGPEELSERWRRAMGMDAPQLTWMLAPATPASILVRILNNLRMVHAQARRYRLAALANEKMVLLEPQNPYHERDLGLLLLGAGDLAEGVTCLERFLERAPDSEDSPALRARLAALKDELAKGALD